jgi:hypothetical protein
VKFTRSLVGGALALTSVIAGAQGSIAGTVYDSLSTHAPLANATVVLVERSRYATTDAHGRFRIDSVPDGHYTIGFMHAVLDSLDLEAPVVPVDVAGGRAAAVALYTPSPSAVYERICSVARDVDTGILIGRVRDVDDASPLSDANVHTLWTEFFLAAGRSSGHRVRAAARTDAKGAFLLCGVPTEVPLDVYTESAGFVAGPVSLMPQDRLIRHIDFALSRKDSAARTGLTGDSSSAAAGLPPGTATLRGAVRDAGGRPLRDATVGVVGTQRSSHTDGTGAFRISNIPAGTRTIEVRSIGWLPTTFRIDFATNANRDTTLSIMRQAQDLTKVAINERDNSSPLMGGGGFDARRAQGLGKFVTREDLARHPSSSLSDVLADVQGVHLEYGTNGFPLPYLRGTKGSYCIPNFFLNGTPFMVDGALRPHGKTSEQPQHPFSDLADAAQPVNIRGIEIYSNPGTIPAQYDLMSSTQCGSVVIWTR